MRCENVITYRINRGAGDGDRDIGAPGQAPWLQPANRSCVHTQAPTSPSAQHPHDAQHPHPPREGAQGRWGTLPALGDVVLGLCLGAARCTQRPHQPPLGPGCCAHGVCPSSCPPAWHRGSCWEHWGRTDTVARCPQVMAGRVRGQGRVRGDRYLGMPGTRRGQAAWGNRHRARCSVCVQDYTCFCARLFQCMPVPVRARVCGCACRHTRLCPCVHAHARCCGDPARRCAWSVGVCTRESEL